MNLSKLFKVILPVILLAFIYSCGNKSEDTSKNVSKTETEKISDTNFTETDEDLFAVDYKEFYDQLAPHGQWIEVTGKEIGIDVKSGSSLMEGEQKKITLAGLFGVNSAYALVDVGTFFVWQPSSDLSVGINTGTAGTTTGTTAGATTYVPYTNGQWVNTDAGWYFKAPTDYEETTSHYGRWVNSPAQGWVWMPGRVWSPAWVDWREDDNNIAWTPLPPSSYIVNNFITPPQIVENNYIVVERKYFVEPDIYKYMYKENKNKIMIKEMRRIDGVMVVNKTIINKGPDVTIIRQVTNQPIELVKIDRVKTRGDVKYSSDRYSVYTPQFVKVKGKSNEKIPMFKPEKYKNYKELKPYNKEGEYKGEGKGNENEGKGMDNEKKSKDEGKGYNKEGKKKLGDDSEMKEKGKNNGNDNKGYEKEKQNKGNDKDKGNDKGNNKEKGNNKDKGNDKDKGKK
jgi:hypothetical protein